MSIEADVAIEKCRKLYKRIATQREVVKNATKRIKDMSAEIERVVNDSGHGEIPLEWPTRWICTKCRTFFDQNQPAAVEEVEEAEEDEPAEVDS